MFPMYILIRRNLAIVLLLIVLLFCVPLSGEQLSLFGLVGGDWCLIRFVYIGPTGVHFVLPRLKPGL